MKRYLFVFLVLASLVLSFGNAFAGGGASAPSFGITAGWIKLGDMIDPYGTWQSGQHELIGDGSNVYAARVGGLDEVVMDKSNDGGLTWLQGTVIATASNNYHIQYHPGIAMNPVTKALHYTWPANETTHNLYYGNGTTTTKVNGSVDISNDFGPIAVDGNGVIHIVFTDWNSLIYYTSSSDNGVTFSGPAAIASGGYVSMTSDSAGNLYLGYRGNDGYNYFMKKLQSGSWSSPYLVCTSCSVDAPSIAAYDSNTIYYAMDTIIAATSNGGQTWTLYPAPVVAATNPEYRSLAISSSGILNLAWHAYDALGNYNVYFARTTKSLDPTSWGRTAIAIAGAFFPNLALDFAGKAYIMATGKTVASVAVFTKEK